MCGLLGMFGDFNTNDLKYLRQGIVADYFRGKHSTGLACIKDDSVVVHKETLNPIDFMELPKVDKSVTVNHLGFIGHNRHATLGGVTRNNAHPFTHDNITLAHNGTLDNKRALESKYLESGDFDTDSELVCFLLANFKAKVIIEALSGAFALTWWDSKTQTMNLVRNDERPLYVVVFEKKVYWGSEELMVKWLMDRNSLDTYKHKAFELEVGEHIEFKLDKTILVKRTKYKLQEKAWAGYNYNNSYNGKYGGGYNDYNASKRGSSYNRGATYSNPAVNRFSEFNKEHGTDFKDGQHVYAWLTDVNFRTADRKHADLTFTVACHPYCDLKVYHTPYSEKLYTLDPNKEDAPYGFKLRLTGVSWSKGKPVSMLVSSTDIVPVLTEQENEALSDWTGENTPPLLLGDLTTKKN